MPLRIVLRNGLDVPVVFCDQCGQEIERASGGSYLWRIGKGGTEGVAIYFVHAACCQPFERKNEGPWGAMEIEYLPVYLVNNLKVDWERAKSRAEFLGRLGQ